MLLLCIRPLHTWTKKGPHYLVAMQLRPEQSTSIGEMINQSTTFFHMHSSHDYRVIPMSAPISSFHTEIKKHLIAEFIFIFKISNRSSFSYSNRFLVSLFKFVCFVGFSSFFSFYSFPLPSLPH